MPERATTFERFAIGVEALNAPGTPVPATRILGSLSATVGANPDVKTLTPKGSKFASAAVLASENTQIKLDGMGTYNELIYPLAGVLNDPVITTPAGATLARKYLFAMQSMSPDAPRTFSSEAGSQALRAWHAAYMFLTDFGLVFTKKDMVKASGSAIAQAGLDDKVRWLVLAGIPTGGTFTITVGANTTSAIPYNATAAQVQAALVALASVGAGNVVATGGPLPASPIRVLFTGTFDSAALPTMSTTDTLTGGTTPTSSFTRLTPSATQLPLVPISPTTIDVYAATSYAGLAGAPKLLRNFAASWKIGSRMNMFNPMNSALGAGFGGVVEATPKGEFSLDVGGDDVGMGFLPVLRRGDTAFFRITATGPQIEVALGTPIYHSITITVAVKLTKPSEMKDIDGGLVGLTYSGEWTHDPTWGYASQVEIVTNVAAL